MFLKGLFSVLISSVITTSAYSQNLNANVDWNKVVQDQNAEAAQLLVSLHSARSDLQAQALEALLKIVTSSSLKTLIAAQDKITSENYNDYCLALGQMYLVNMGAVGEPAQLELIQQALVILENAVLVGQYVSYCYEAFAKISPRSADTKVESLFMGIDFSQLSDADKARAVMALYFHRQNT